MSGGKLTTDGVDHKEDAFQVLSEQDVAALKEAWSKDPPTRLPPFGHLVMRLIATVERSRRAYALADRKWDEARALAEKYREALAKIADLETSDSRAYKISRKALAQAEKDTP